MESSQVASALGISGVTLAVVTAIGLAVARGLRSRCVVMGVAVDIHPATQEELQGAQAQAQGQEATQASHVSVTVNTPAAPHEAEHEAPPPIKAPRASAAVE